MVIKCITLPHKVMYSAAGKTVAYEDLSMASFVQGYLIVIRGEEGHTKDKMAVQLEELMSDCNLCGWERVRPYHSVWLNQIEQGELTWDDTEEKLRFSWAHVSMWQEVP